MEPVIWVDLVDLDTAVRLVVVAVRVILGVAFVAAGIALTVLGFGAAIADIIPHQRGDTDSRFDGMGLIYGGLIMGPLGVGITAVGLVFLGIVPAAPPWPPLWS